MADEEEAGVIPMGPEFKGEVSLKEWMGCFLEKEMALSLCRNIYKGVGGVGMVYGQGRHTRSFITPLMSSTRVSAFDKGDCP